MPARVDVAKDRKKLCHYKEMNVQRFAHAVWWLRVITLNSASCGRPCLEFQLPYPGNAC
jgi:hypothetical protein